MFAVSMAKITELRYELLLYPPYFRDLANSYYFLFPNLKKLRGGKRFTSNYEVIPETSGYFANFERSYLLEDLKKILKTNGISVLN